MCRAGGRRLRQLRRAEEEEEEKRETLLLPLPIPKNSSAIHLRLSRIRLEKKRDGMRGWEEEASTTCWLSKCILGQRRGWRQVHEGESRVSPFAGVGASRPPPPIVQRATHPPKRGVPKNEIAYFPLWRRKGPRG